MAIKIPDDFLSFAPIYKFSDSRKGLSEFDMPSGTDTDGMQAAKSLLSLYRDLSDVIRSYSVLIEYDGERIRRIVDSFVQYDNAN